MDILHCLLFLEIILLHFPNGIACGIMTSLSLIAFVISLSSFWVKQKDEVYEELCSNDDISTAICGNTGPSYKGLQSLRTSYR